MKLHCLILSKVIFHLSKSTLLHYWILIIISFLHCLGNKKKIVFLSVSKKGIEFYGNEELLDNLLEKNDPNCQYKSVPRSSKSDSKLTKRFSSSLVRLKRIKSANRPLSQSLDSPTSPQSDSVDSPNTDQNRLSVLYEVYTSPCINLKLPAFSSIFSTDLCLESLPHSSDQFSFLAGSVTDVLHYLFLHSDIEHQSISLSLSFSSLTFFLFISMNLLLFPFLFSFLSCKI